MRARNLDDILSKKVFASVVRCTLVASSGMVILSATSAAADDTAAFQRLEAKIQQLETRHENEIKALQAEIRRLRQEKPVRAAATQPLPAQPQPSSAPPSYAPPSGLPAPALPAKVLMTYDRGYHFGFSDATGDNTVELFGRLQLDAGGYTGYNPAPMTLDRKGLSDGIDLRRARIGVIGTFMTDWHYAFVYDFGNSSDSSNINNAFANANSSTSPTTSNTFLSGVENAFLTYNGFYNQGRPFPVAFDFGIMDVPWTLEEATSSNDLMFMERSTAQVIATSFGGGDFRSSLDLRSNNDRYWLGLFLTGPNAGALHTAGASCNTGTVAVTPGTPCVTSAQMTGLGPQFSFLARGAYQLVQQNDATLHLGFNYANLFAPRIGANAAGISLSDRPELRVDPTSLLATGNIPAAAGRFMASRSRDRSGISSRRANTNITSSTPARECRQFRAICRAAFPAPHSISTAVTPRQATASVGPGITIQPAAPIPASFRKTRWHREAPAGARSNLPGVSVSSISTARF
jgi:phosphate-selective porin OprO and OprP